MYALACCFVSSYIDASPFASIEKGRRCIFEISTELAISINDWKSCALELIDKAITDESHLIHSLRKKHIALIEYVPESLEERTFTFSFFNPHEKYFSFRATMDGKELLGEIILKKFTQFNGQNDQLDPSTKVVSLDFSSHCPSNQHRSYEFLVQTLDGEEILSISKLKPAIFCTTPRIPK